MKVRIFDRVPAARLACPRLLDRGCLRWRKLYWRVDLISNTLDRFLHNAGVSGITAASPFATFNHKYRSDSVPPTKCMNVRICTWATTFPILSFDAYIDFGIRHKMTFPRWDVLHTSEQTVSEGLSELVYPLRHTIDGFQGKTFGLRQDVECKIWHH